MDSKALHIMECHVEGYTKQCPYIEKKYRGKYLGLCHPFMIEHLKKLDVNAVQIQPVMASKNTYWGYDPISWMKHNTSYGTLHNLRTMVKTLQENGIKVVLDIVFNHTAKDIKGVQYYDWNVTGCNNTVDVKKSLPTILKAMEFWLDDVGADGFRYDLAGVLGREGGDFNPDAKFFKEVEERWSHKLHIAEPYDLPECSLGRFPSHWYELNHHARDTIRAGHPYKGTPPISEERSIGYVTCHDGFTLNDLTSYNRKHNWANGEANRDGVNDNLSYNHGVEGETNDDTINAARKEHQGWLIDNLKSNCKHWLILEGDEFRNSKQGNNNTYLHGNQTSWVDWSRYKEFF